MNKPTRAYDVTSRGLLHFSRTAMLYRPCGAGRLATARGSIRARPLFREDAIRACFSSQTQPMYPARCIALFYLSARAYHVASRVVSGFVSRRFLRRVVRFEITGRFLAALISVKIRSRYTRPIRDPTTRARVICTHRSRKL